MNMCELIAKYNDLRGDADCAVHYYAYISALMGNNKAAECIDASRTGIALIISRISIKSSLILYCARAWDDGRNVTSLKCISNNLPAIEEFKAHHDISSENDSQLRIVRAYENFKSECDKIAQHPVHSVFRIHRTEDFAHLIKNSCDRKHAIEKNKRTDDSNYRELLEISGRTINLVGELGYLINRITNPYPERISRIKSQCLEFWDIMPNLREFET